VQQQLSFLNVISTFSLWNNFYFLKFCWYLFVEKYAYAADKGLQWRMSGFLLYINMNMTGR
jgi:hypothetical protein